MVIKTGNTVEWNIELTPVLFVGELLSPLATIPPLVAPIKMIEFVQDAYMWLLESKIG